ncbi:MAG: MarR family transcriptional regulator [Ruminococcus sp.]|nr:MarR family transcriptional regulator [Ruminococcus sp.]
MEEELCRECLRSIYDIYPLMRKLAMDTFENDETKLTRTQQIALLSLSREKVLNMSQLAATINTSNEQATRAVSQLVDMGLIERSKDIHNRRMINVRLTEKAEQLLKRIKDAVVEDSVRKLSVLPAEDQVKLTESLKVVCSLIRRANGL